jgi:hypothetical protein
MQCVFNFVHDNKVTPHHFSDELRKNLISYSGKYGITIVHKDQCSHKVGAIDTIG